MEINESNKSETKKILPKCKATQKLKEETELYIQR